MGVFVDEKLSVHSRCEKIENFSGKIEMECGKRIEILVYLWIME